LKGEGRKKLEKKQTSRRKKGRGELHSHATIRFTKKEGKKELRGSSLGRSSFAAKGKGKRPEGGVNLEGGEPAVFA